MRRPVQLTIGIIVMLGALGVGHWWVRTVQPVGVIRAQLRAIDEGMYPQAYDYLSSTAKATWSFDEFVALIQYNPVVMETRVSTFSSRSVNGNTATIGGVLEGYGLDVSEATYVLVKEGNQWRIENFAWGPPHQ